MYSLCIRTNYLESDDHEHICSQFGAEEAGESSGYVVYEFATKEKAIAARAYLAEAMFAIMETANEDQ